MMTRSKTHGWAAVVVSAMMLGACGEQPREDAAPPPGEAPPAAGAATSAGEAAAEALPVVDLAGLRQIVATNAAAGKVTVVDFWATWCVPCVTIFPELHAALHGMGDAVAPISVTIDSPGKYEQQAIAFLDQHHAREGAYILAVDPEEQERVVDELGEKWNDFVVPAILVFDREGELAGEFVGNVEAQPAKIVQRVRELLSPAPLPAPAAATTAPVAPMEGS